MCHTADGSVQSSDLRCFLRFLSLDRLDWHELAGHGFCDAWWFKMRRQPIYLWYFLSMWYALIDINLTKPGQVQITLIRHDHLKILRIFRNWSGLAKLAI